MTRTRQNRIFSIIRITIIISAKSEGTSNSVVSVPQGKISLSTTRIAYRIIDINVVIVKGNAILTLNSSSPEFVLNKLLPLSVLLGIIGFINVTEIERRYFRGDGKICCEKSK